MNTNRRNVDKPRNKFVTWANSRQNNKKEGTRGSPSEEKYYFNYPRPSKKIRPPSEARAGGKEEEEAEEEVLIPFWWALGSRAGGGRLEGAFRPPAPVNRAAAESEHTGAAQATDHKTVMLAFGLDQPDLS